MKTLIGGAVGAVLGLIGMSIWWKPFLQLLAGAIPVMLLLGGGLALYLGFDELKDSWKKEDTTVDTPVSTDDTEEYKKDIDELKKMDPEDPNLLVFLQRFEMIVTYQELVENLEKRRFVMKSESMVFSS